MDHWATLRRAKAISGCAEPAAPPPARPAPAGTASRLRSKQHLLDILLERIRDQSSYTRKAVLQAWAYLAEAHAIPLGHWREIPVIAVGAWGGRLALLLPEGSRGAGGPAFLALHSFSARISVVASRPALSHGTPQRQARASPR